MRHAFNAHQTFVIERDFSSCADLFDKISRLCQGWGLTERQWGRLLIVLDECLSNVVRHGAGRLIHVRVRLGVSHLYVLMVDEAPPFSPMNKTVKKKKTKEGGHGLILIHALADGLHYRRLKSGNGILLSHRLNV